MLVLLFPGINCSELIEKYNENIISISENNYKNDKQFPINYLEVIKKCLLEYDIVFIPYSDIFLYLDGLQLNYKIISPSKDYIKDARFLNYQYLLKGLKISDKLIFIDSDNEVYDIIKEYMNIEEKDSKEEEKTEEISLTESQDVINSNGKLTLKELADDNRDLVESDLREFKEIQNKLKLGMMLQAKNSLKRILKLSEMLDRLYDKAMDHMDKHMEEFELKDIMALTRYISSSLTATNDLVLSLITNDKVQNLFVIDNSSININSNEADDIDSRNRIRKAVEIVLNNYEAIESGCFNNVKDPNVIEVKKEDVKVQGVNNKEESEDGNNQTNSI